MIKWFLRLKRQEIIEIYRNNKLMIQFLIWFALSYLAWMFCITNKEFINDDMNEKIVIICLGVFFSLILSALFSFIVTPIS